jgi:restriction system protein
MSDETMPSRPTDMATEALMMHWGNRNVIVNRPITARRHTFPGFVRTSQLAPNATDVLPTLLMQTLLTPQGQTADGMMIQAVTIPWKEILKLIKNDPDVIYQIDPRKWEEIIAGSYQASGLFDEVILTPASGDHGRDVIATKYGFCSIRCIESVKRYTPGRVVEANDVRALGFAMMADPKVNKGVVSTTWEFAPKIEDDPNIKAFLPHRIELINKAKLIERFEQWESPEGPQGY